MADTPPPGLPPTSAAPPARAPTPPTIPRPPSRWLPAAALAVALAALVVAIMGWSRPVPPPPPGEPTFTEQQVADAKARVCEAFALVKRGLVLQTKIEPSDDSAKIDARAANARLAIVSNARYLQDHLDSGTPPQLATDIHHLATVMLDLAANYMAGQRDNDPPQAARLSDAEATVTRVEELCK